MVSEDLEFDNAVEDDDSSGIEGFNAKDASNAADTRRRLEAKLEEARLNRLMNDYDFD